MATYHSITASNWPTIDPDSVSEVKATIDDYKFVGNWENLTVTVRDKETDEPQIALYGNAPFDATKPILEDGVPVDREHGYTEEFLERLAPYLEEQLVVETIGHEKCRFPLTAVQWTVWPDGTVQHNSFNHQPKKTETDDENDGQFGVLNTERGVFLKLGSGGPALTSHRDKAIEAASGKYNSHLDPVRVETTPIAEDEESQ